MHKLIFTRRVLAAAAIGLAFAVGAASGALAQQPGSRIRGEVVKADGPKLEVKTRDGAMLNVTLDEKARVSCRRLTAASRLSRSTCSYRRSAAWCPTGTARGTPSRTAP